MRLQSLIAVVLIILAGCSDSRPSKSEAEAWFLKTYPGASLENVEVIFDEVVTRDFRFTYRTANSTKSDFIDIQFLEDAGTGKWKPYPPPPAALP